MIVLALAGIMLRLLLSMEIIRKKMKYACYVIFLAKITGIIFLI